MKLLKSMVETGVMVMKGDKAWGVLYEDGRSREEGWCDPCEAEIHDPKYTHKPTDVTWRGSHYMPQLKEGRLVRVLRTTTVEVLDD